METHPFVAERARMARREITVLGRRYTGDAAHRQFGISKVRRIECAAHRQYGVLEMQCIARLNRFYSMRPRTQKAPRIARSFPGDGRVLLIYHW